MTMFMFHGFALLLICFIIMVVMILRFVFGRFFVTMFLIMAFIVYFFIVKPYELAKEKFVKSEEEDAAPNADTVLLTEIRDALVRDRT